MAHYYQTLSIDGVKAFIASLQYASKFTTNQEKDDEGDVTLTSNKQQDASEEAEICNNQSIAQQYQETSKNLEEIQVNSKNGINYSGYEILNYIANSINPYTGEYAINQIKN